jgi:hypothetical protein
MGKISYEEIAIKQLENWDWHVEKYRLYGLPWYLKVWLYPVIWGIKGEVEAGIRRLMKGDGGNGQER